MLKLSTRLFAAGTLAAVLIGVTQDGFASQKAPKSAKAATMSCCEKKDGVMSCPKNAAASTKAKTASTKAGKVGAKTVSNAKMTPKSGKVAGKAAAVKTSAKAAAAKPASCCQDPNAKSA